MARNKFAITLLLSWLAVIFEPTIRKVVLVSQGLVVRNLDDGMIRRVEPGPPELRESGGSGGCIPLRNGRVTCAWFAAS
jgi:hypothetical protein